MNKMHPIVPKSNKEVEQEKEKEEDFGPSLDLFFQPKQSNSVKSETKEEFSENKRRKIKTNVPSQDAINQAEDEG